MDFNNPFTKFTKSSREITKLYYKIKDSKTHLPNLLQFQENHKFTPHNQGFNNPFTKLTKFSRKITKSHYTIKDSVTPLPNLLIF